MTDQPSLLVTGGTGMVGCAIKELYPSAICLGTRDGDLRSPIACREIFFKHRPRYVIHLAARVGGVKGNSDFMADFYSDNVLINANVLKCAALYNVKRMVSMLSTCVYPDKAKYPLTEEQMHLGPPHASNFGYAHAKRMLDVHSRACNQQYGTDFFCAIPNNIYGSHDNFDLDNGHVVPAMIRKIWEAKHARTDVTLWGDGSPLREFTHASDIARGVLFLLWTAGTTHPMVNIGGTHEYSIKEVAEKIAKYLDFQGKIVWDTSMPAGQHRKPSSNKKFLDLGFNPDSYTHLDAGLEQTCEWFKNQYPYVRGIKKSDR